MLVVVSVCYDADALTARISRCVKLSNILKSIGGSRDLAPRHVGLTQSTPPCLQPKMSGASQPAHSNALGLQSGLGNGVHARPRPSVVQSQCEESRGGQRREGRRGVHGCEYRTRNAGVRERAVSLSTTYKACDVGRAASRWELAEGCYRVAALPMAQIPLPVYLMAVPAAFVTPFPTPVRT